ncbi:MAG: hypothetical protein KGO92_12030 [Bacteroidota bacterium]|nr:hypothetical protein [Bacteroidota bacterium]
MKRQIRRSFLAILLISTLSGSRLLAQESKPKWTPEELRELFNYCQKPELMKKLGVGEEVADKIGDIEYWTLLQYNKVDNNTNDTFATKGEIQEEAVKRYKSSARLSADQVKIVLDYQDPFSNNPASCAVTTLHYVPLTEGMPTPQIVLQYQAKFRKSLVDKLGINGRQANLLCELEVGKQKEAKEIAAIPLNDINRIRKTVALNQDIEKRYRGLGLDDGQIEKALAFFQENEAGNKK